LIAGAGASLSLLLFPEVVVVHAGKMIRFLSVSGHKVQPPLLVEGVSRRQVQLEAMMHWKTLRKVLKHNKPPGYRQERQRPKRKIGPFGKRVRQIFKENKALPARLRQTAKRIFERLRDEPDSTGGCTVVRLLVKDMEQKNREVFVPLAHPPGEAQVDFGHALVKEGASAQGGVLCDGAAV
jgi:hypothetical protein